MSYPSDFGQTDLNSLFRIFIKKAHYVSSNAYIEWIYSSLTDLKRKKTVSGGISFVQNKLFYEFIDSYGLLHAIQHLHQ